MTRRKWIIIIVVLIILMVLVWGWLYVYWTSQQVTQIFEDIYLTLTASP